MLLVGAALSWLLVVVLGSMLPLLRWIEHAERERIQRHAQRDMAKELGMAQFRAEAALATADEAERLRNLAEQRGTAS